MDQNLRLLFTEMLRRTGRCRALYDGPEGMLLQTGGNGLSAAFRMRAPCCAYCGA